jgi:hypothetical protein
MSSPNDPKPLEPGPYATTHTTTVTTAPITFTFTTEYKSSHVPPPAQPCGCGGGGSIAPGVLEQIMAAIMNATNASPADDHEH